MGLCLSKKGLQQEKISSPTSPPPNSTSNSLPRQKEKTPLKVKEEIPAAEAKKQIVVVAKQNKVQESKKEEKGEDPKRTEITLKEEYCNGVTAAVRTSNCTKEDCNGVTAAVRTLNCTKEDYCNGITAAVRTSSCTKEEYCKGVTAAVRTSSCTKEEVDAILIQCGRMSRSSSGKGSNENNGRGINSSGSRKYAGSKRSYDFDHDSAEKNYDDGEKHQTRPAHRRTPSREKDAGASELKHSGSREEGRRSGSRRASRSPGRRQETPTEKTRPGKMVSVPATVSTAREARTGVKKVSTTTAKRSGEVVVRSSASPRARSPANNRASNENREVGVRSSASPRAQSPANARASNENSHHQHSQPSLSRNSSRKAELLPYRRNPLNEIDENILRTEQPALKNQDYDKKISNKSNNKIARRKEGEEGTNKASHLQLQKAKENAAQTQKSNERNIVTVEIPHETNSNSSRRIREQLMSCRAMEQQQESEIVEDVADAKGNDVAAMTHGTESLIPQTITRTRSSRRSRDLDLGMGLNPEALLNPSSYASLLLEDIQNYHNQNAAFSLPSCVSKACSILEAVADLNSCTSSNLSPAFSEEKSFEPDWPNHYNNNISLNKCYNRRLMPKDPFVESEVVMNDNDLTEPSLHRYVTVRDPVRDMEQQESAGSNSFLGHHWSSSWEPNSADSTDRWTSLSNTGEEVEQHQHLGSKNGKVGVRSFSQPSVAACAGH